MMSHDEAYDLLAPLSLDAVEADTARAVEEHVATCPACRDELDHFRETAAALGNSVVDLPEDLWGGIAASLAQRPGPNVVAMPSLVSSRRATASRRRHRERVGAGALGLAAAAAVLVLGLSLAHADSRVNRLTGALARAQRGVVASALATPGHRVVDLRAGSTRVASFVLVPDGRGYLMNASMAPLSAGRTYQLWAIVGGKPVSLGLMGRAPGPVVFTLADASGASALAVTIEPANGSSVPSSAPVAQGSISA